MKGCGCRLRTPHNRPPGANPREDRPPRSPQDDDHNDLSWPRKRPTHGWKQGSDQDKKRLDSTSDLERQHDVWGTGAWGGVHGNRGDEGEVEPGTGGGGPSSAPMVTREGEGRTGWGRISGTGDDAWGTWSRVRVCFRKCRSQNVGRTRV